MKNETNITWVNAPGLMSPATPVGQQREPQPLSRHEAALRAMQDDETPEAVAARRLRAERYNEVAKYLWEKLFQYSDVRFEADGWGKVTQTKKGNQNVKGWFGKPLGSDEDVLITAVTGLLTNEIMASRKVIYMMENLGFCYRYEKRPDEPHKATFFVPRADVPALDNFVYTAIEDEEAFAVCASAKLALQELMFKERQD